MTVGPRLEYVPGRDVLINAQQIAAGLEVFEKRSGQHVLTGAAVPLEILCKGFPAIQCVLHRFYEGRLPINIDGRANAGPVDLKAFLAQPRVQKEVYLCICIHSILFPQSPGMDMIFAPLGGSGSRVGGLKMVTNLLKSHANPESIETKQRCPR